MSTVLIRAASAPDYRAVDKLLVEQNHFHGQLHPDAITPINQRLTRREFEIILGESGQEILVAELGPQVVGLAWLIRRRLEGQGIASMNVAFVQEICVTGDRRQQGIGRQLMQAVMQWAKDRKLDRVEFNVWANNADALAFYKALGFGYLRHEMSKPVQ